jgi:hypothetical protein
MAIKTFSDGNSLPASDINTYLTNSGLVYVTSATVGTAVSSVTVTGAFNSTYENYKIVYAGLGGSTTIHLGFRLGSTATGYYGGLIYNTAATPTPLGASDNNASLFTYAAGGNGNQMVLNCDILNPFLTQYTLISAFNFSFANFGLYNGVLQNSTSYTAFTLIPSAGTITGGTITVYGYRKA